MSGLLTLRVKGTMQIVEKYRFKPLQKVFDFVDAYQLERQVPNVVSPPPRPIGQLQLFLANNEKEFLLRQNPSGYLLFFGDVLYPNGIVFQGLYKGKVLLTIKSAFYQEEKIAVDLWSPENDVSKQFYFELKPNYAYPLPKIPFGSGDTLLRGHVEDVVGEKVSGVQITAVVNTHTLTYSQTDRTGQFLFFAPKELVDGEEIAVQLRMKKGNRQKDVVRSVVIEKGKSISLDKLIWADE